MARLITRNMRAEPDPSWDGHDLLMPCRRSTDHPPPSDFEETAHALPAATVPTCLGDELEDQPTLRRDTRALLADLQEDDITVPYLAACGEGSTCPDDECDDQAEDEADDEQAGAGIATLRPLSTTVEPPAGIRPRRRTHGLRATAAASLVLVATTVSLFAFRREGDSVRSATLGARLRNETVAAVDSAQLTVASAPSSSTSIHPMPKSNTGKTLGTKLVRK